MAEPEAVTPERSAPEATPAARVASKAWWRKLWQGTLWRSIVVLLMCLGAGTYYLGKLDVAYAIKDWLFWPIALMWLYSVVLFSACFSVGLRVLTWLKVGGSALERFAFAMPTGVLAFCLGMYGLGALRLFNRPAAIVLALLLLASGAVPAYRFVRSVLGQWTAPAAWPDPIAARLIRVVALGYGVVCLVLLYLPCLTHESLNFDAQWCHLTVAQDYAREGRIIPYDGDYARNHPQLAPMLHTWGWLMPVPSLLQRWTLPLHTEFCMVVLSLAGMAAVVRYLLRQQRVRMAWVGFFLFTAIFVYDMNLGGSSDHFFGLFTAPLFLAVARAATSFDRRYLILTAICGGGALMTKYQAAYILPVCVLVLVGGLLAGVARQVLSLRRAAGSNAKQIWAQLQLRRYVIGPLVALGVFVAVVSPHFIRNWVFYHNPVLPFMQGFFDTNPSQPDAVYFFENVFQDYNWRPHGTLMERLTSSVKLLATFSFSPSYYFFRADWPVYGSLFTFSIPFILVVRRSSRLWLGVLVGLGTVFTWAMTFRVERNLQGFVPIVAATTVALLVRAWQLGWLARVGVVALVALQLVWGGDALVYSQHGRLAAAINLIRGGYERTTAQRFSTHPLVQAGASLPPDAKVMYHQNRPTLGLNRVVALDLTGSQTLFGYAKVENVSQLVGEWRKGGITHVMYDLPTGFGRESRKLEVLWQLFIRAAGRGKQFGSYGLVDIRPLRDLPAEKGLRVVMVGVPGYQDGVYPLSKLGLIEYLPDHLRKYPLPERPIPSDPAALEEMVEGASAALITGSSTPTRKAMLDKGWTSVHGYSGYFSVYLPPGEAQGGNRRKHK